MGPWAIWGNVPAADAAHWPSSFEHKTLSVTAVLEPSNEPSENIPYEGFDRYEGYPNVKLHVAGYRRV